MRKISFLFFMSIIISPLFSMEKKVLNKTQTLVNYFSLIPKEIFLHIIYSIKYKHPWLNVAYIVRLKKVSNQWCELIEHANIVKILNIPPMCLAAVHGDSDEIIRL